VVIDRGLGKEQGRVPKKNRDTALKKTGTPPLVGSGPA
jgi:hypothetical protein